VSKASEKATVQAVDQAVALRRRIVDCRFPRNTETKLLDQTSELIDAIEAAATPAGPEKEGQENAG
jgi:hypothetical protein